MAKPHFRSDYSKHPSQPCWNAVCVPLTEGYHTLVSAEDFERATENKWQVCYGRSGKPYAYRGRNRRLARYILGYDGSDTVDHVNGNSLDNRRENLRICTIAENNYNMQKPIGQSGYRGVGKISSQKWRASIFYKKTHYNSPLVDSPVFAAAIYDCFSHRLHGEYGIRNLNLSKEEQSDIWEWLFQQPKYSADGLFNAL